MLDKAMTLSQVYDEFILEKLCERKSPRTISSYDVKLGIFFQSVGADTVIGDLKVVDVRRYIMQLNNKRKKNGEFLEPGAVQTYVRHLRAFLNYSYQNKGSDIDWLREIKLPKAPRKVEDILSDDEVMLIIADLKTIEDDFFRTRNTAIFTLMIDTGIRAEEVENIMLDDVRYDDGYIKIRGKGAKERLVKLSPVVKRNLKRYLLHRKIKSRDIKALFVLRTGERFTYDALKKIFQNIKDGTEIKRLHPHLLRHTFATRKILVDGVDLFSLQIMLGHETLEMTRKYSHLSSQYQVAGVDFKPLTQLIA